MFALFTSGSAVTQKLLSTIPSPPRSNRTRQHHPLTHIFSPSVKCITSQDELITGQDELITGQDELILRCCSTCSRLPYRNMKSRRALHFRDTHSQSSFDIPTPPSPLPPFFKSKYPPVVNSVEPTESQNLSVVSYQFCIRFLSGSISPGYARR